MNTRVKKTKKVFNKENYNETAVKKIKKSNPKTNHLKDILNYFDMKSKKCVTNY